LPFVAAIPIFTRQFIFLISLPTHSPVDFNYYC